MINTDDILVVILGGGKGSRLYPLTKKRSKPAVNFGGKYRLIDITITNCLKSNLNKIFVLTQFNSFSLNRHVWQAYSNEIKRGGFIDIIAAEQTNNNPNWFQGTADAVRQTLPYILYHNPKYVLILSGDQIYSMNFGKMLNYHKKQNSDITIASHFTKISDIHRLGIIDCDAKCKVKGFYEKPENEDLIKTYRLKNKNIECPDDKPYFGSMGIYLFNTAVLTDALKSDESDFGKDIIPMCAEKSKMYCYPFNGYWEDVGTIKTFYDANMEWMHGKGISTLFQGGNSIFTHSRQLAPARILSTLTVNSIIADGSVIKADKIYESIIGVRTFIGDNTEVYNSIIMGSDDRTKDSYNIGSNCIIKNSIIDKNVAIGNNCRIINKDNINNLETEKYCIKDGIVVIPQDTIIPDGTTI
jgi:glucose-1-phosphate adenylyltransferase